MKPSQLKISYITTYDASDIHNWSGLGFTMANMLENQNAEIEYIGNLTVYRKKLFKLKELYYQTILNKNYLMKREPLVARNYAKQARTQISKDTDIIFSPGSLPLAYLNSNKPKVFYTDATFAGMLNFYNGYSNLCGESIRKGHLLEQEALNTCKLAIYASDWAAKTALENYSVNPDKVKVVPFGANIEGNRTLADIKQIIDRRSETECHLLFIGVDWKRKGCDLAVEITERLNSMGLKTFLHIVGLRELPIDKLPEYIINHGFISKSTTKGKDEINRLLAKSNFLLVPSLAEAYGLVFSEASSFGLPSLSRKVGGIPTVIRDNRNGKTFEIDAKTDEWCNYILSYFNNKLQYKELCKSSFAEYEKRINWQVAGSTIMNLLKDL